MLTEQEITSSQIQEKAQFHFLTQNIEFSSNFQSGNLLKAVQTKPFNFDLWIRSDPHANFRTWFYFAIENVPSGKVVSFTIKNMNNQQKLFKEGFLPVFRTQSQSSQWKTIPTPLQQNSVFKGKDGYEVNFKHPFASSSKHFFALTYPFTNKDSDQFLFKVQKQNKGKIDMQISTLGYSSQKRPIRLVTISQSKQDKEKQNIASLMQTESAKNLNDHKTSLQNKKVFIKQQVKGIFISARVHPGQVVSSHIMNGIIEQLMQSTSILSRLLLQQFVFYIVPIINVDGVANGNFRADSQGKNLNRFYQSPSKQSEPEIFLIRSFLSQMIFSGKIQFCLDLHGHVNKQGVFIYGNSIPDLKGQTQVCLFPKIMAFNCPYFDYQACIFSSNNMSSKDKQDQHTKQGAARVAIFKHTGLLNCWTLECNYSSCKTLNVLNNEQFEQSKTVSNGVLTEKLLPNTSGGVHFFTLKDFSIIGQNICQSIADFYELRERARYFSGKIKNRANFTDNLAIECLRLIPFRFNSNCRKLLIDINSNQNLSAVLKKIRFIVSKRQQSRIKKDSKQNQQGKSRVKSIKFQNKTERKTPNSIYSSYRTQRLIHNHQFGDSAKQKIMKVEKRESSILQIDGKQRKITLTFNKIK